ncbi:MAG TPA: AIM24 family protein [Amaricoccus sp.]|uniref:AIM24 family protein n=1 Tax=Amaricoccus sp. TaxID=1872485 RepID=UPI002B6FCCA3|nr:AIM24 family protein [Amaricoccus sp.]HMQ94109.1 AIM24 family protein [Amaricoccus sp.]HMR54066.1 AIM24 family protein [Amaricoccus sp.]HMR61291.1 AIM24 family protein [Amaricoccus sp.]HMU01048.1 AIM24 family protein [Amaricoccus sp.]
MADFTIREVEGMRQVRVDISGETVRARRGAMSNLRGDIRLTPRLPRFRDLFRSMFTSEAVIRPYYDGTGSILLQPSLGGYHVLDVAPGERWILEPKVYLASEGSIELGMHREPFWAGLWAGDGFFAWKTTMAGGGRAAINAPGPVETVEVDGELRVQGRLVLGRTDGLRFSSQRSARFPRNLISGQSRLRVFTGTGKALVCWTPYWNEHLYKRMTGESIEGSLLE